jgi:8-oxo-dGTP pyrophosphatase MutT (NUDIX family)
MQSSHNSNRTPDELRALIERRLLHSEPAQDPSEARARLMLEVDPLIDKLLPASVRASAVLIPIIHRPEQLTVLFTQRASSLRNHAGQVSFPGGRIEMEDAGIMEAALRETWEEIGLSGEFITVAGYLEPQLTMTGFWIAPVVAFVRPGFTLRPDHREVDSTFEVPLEYILRPDSFVQSLQTFQGVTRPVVSLEYEGRKIWGATARMLQALRALLVNGDPA